MAIIDIGIDQRKQLHRAILEAFPDPPVFGAFLYAELGKNYDQITSIYKSHECRVLEILLLAHGEDWLSRLLTALCSARPLDPLLRLLRDQLQPLLPVPGMDHYEACRLTGEHLLINRRLLREGLRRLQTPNGKRILIVQGAPKTGKSHSVMLVAYLRDTLQNFKLVPVDLEQLARNEGNASPVHAEHIGWKIVSRMKGYESAKLPASSEGQRARWVQEFCDEIEKVAADDTRTWWIVIDAFSKVLLSQSALDLVKELCLRINLTLSQFRLVLLDFSDQLDPVVMPTVEQETIATIGKDELRDFFIAALHGRPAADDPTAIASAVVATLTAAGTGDLTAIAQATRAQLAIELARP